jgi:AcrR family transcriptional regulator
MVLPTSLFYEGCSVSKLAFAKCSAVMRLKPQTPATMRKYPTQERAARTIAAIYEATAQILQAEGDANLTTNRIAERAGFSIGTVYQYFPNKEAILIAVAERERHVILDQIRKTLTKANLQSSADTVRELIRIFIRAFSGRQRLRRAVLLTALRGQGHLKDYGLAQQEVANLLFDPLRANAGNVEAGQRMRSLSEVMVFVLIRSIAGTIRAAVLEESPLLETQDFEDELVRLAMAMLRE